MSEQSPAAELGGPATAERKVLTLLFVDLSGYTHLTATRDPEDVLRTVGPLLTDLRDVATDHGGYVPSVQGDGFLAVFGVPVSHSDDPRRAVEAAIAMRTRVEVRRGAGEDVPDIHVGIASGEVLVTVHAGQHDVIGAPVNLAARLSDAAAPGEVLVDETSAALTVDGAVYGAARTIIVSGFAGAVRVLPLMSVGRGTAGRATMIGRQDQLLALDQALDAVLASGASGVVVVSGEAGAGKTRLVESWTATHPGLTVLQGSCRPYGSPLPLSALSEAITRARDSLATSLSAARDDGTALDDFLSLLPRERRISGLAREPDEALQVAALRLLTAISRRQSTAILLEDLHWSDGPLLDLVHRLHDVPLPGALLVIATSREPAQDLPEVAVPPLSADEVVHVVEQHVGRPPAPALLQLLMERSAGNPLWLVECLALLKDRGQLAVEGAHVVASDADAGTDVPATIRMLVSARLDNLPSTQKVALQRASVWPNEIAISDWPGDAAGVASLVESGLLDLRSHEFVRFAHGLVREAVYRSMPRDARVAEHEALLRTITDPAARAYSALEVHRLDVAPAPGRREFIAERAVRSVIEHARYLRMSHTRAARDVLLRAGEVVNEVETSAPSACAELLTELAEILRALEDGPASAEAASRAAALAALSSDTTAQIRAQLALGEAVLGADNEKARRIAEDILAAAAASESERGRAWTLLGGSHAYDDVAELPRCLEAAFRSYQTAGDSEAAASAARQLAWNLSVTAGADFDHWLTVASATTASSHLYGQGELALVRAVVAQARGEWEQSWASAISAIALTERVGMHQSLVNAVAVAVEAATATGRRAALPGLLARLGTLVEGHRARLQITALCASAPALIMLGQQRDADTALDRASALLPSVGPNEATMLWAARGHTAALAGRHAEAQDAYEQAETLATDLELTLFALGCRLQRFAAQVRQGGRSGLKADVLAVAEELEAARASPLAAAARSLAGTVPD
jgi:class 3 adenylate cyclase/tetratricopeptide (TPR) repeat protein